jgi:formiminoglutamase
MARETNDPRLGDAIGRRAGDASRRVVLVGFPSDEGVRRNGGRIGAAQGPRAIRQALFRLTPDPRCHDAFVDLVETTLDAGDVEVTGDVEADQEKLAATIAPHLGAGSVVIVLGGGHETTFGHFLGYVKAAQRVSLLNFDAHPDVRPLRDGKGHSGSPFRQALVHESGCCAGYTVAGLEPHSTARAHLDYIEEKEGSYLFREELGEERVETLFAAPMERTLVSFDLDAVDSSLAPGVSAPAPVGLDAALWLHAARAAGRCALVRSIDVVELNPLYDVDGRTARLAALTVWSFLRGLVERFAQARPPR